ERQQEKVNWREQKLSVENGRSERKIPRQKQKRDGPLSRPVPELLFELELRILRSPGSVSQPRSPIRPDWVVRVVGVADIPWAADSDHEKDKCSHLTELSLF